ncbi:hypothetical protein FNV43_RR01327 [Rhamnella rubrinervis]|uniref:Uncharacterized protein n=1 Tax=Rhamnella rubrinervis TaxID=2594499 RepID=A0A8K0HS86_9ROSA|nr:hypothetical protein FNV43_RR01327 [Rhamnella rubrinervis]
MGDVTRPACNIRRLNGILALSTVDEDTGDDGEPVKRVSEEVNPLSRCHKGGCHHPESKLKVFVIEDQKHAAVARIARSQCMGSHDNWMASSIHVVFQDVLKCGSNLSIHSTQSMEKEGRLQGRDRACVVCKTFFALFWFRYAVATWFWLLLGLKVLKELQTAVNWNGMLECLSRNESLEARMEWIRLDGMLGWNESLTSPNKGKLITKNFVGQ